jgi:putative Holliday junction resolvase
VTRLEEGLRDAPREDVDVTRVLALDFGSARCGVAVSDATRTLATPLPAVERPATKRGIGALARIVEEREVGQVVVGLPLTLRGAEGAQAAETRAFAERLARRVAVPVELHDERLTSRQALRSGGRSELDSRAAAHLLEAWLAGAGARS